VLQILIAVELDPGRTVGPARERLALAQGSESTGLARLQQRGLIEFVPEGRDARRQPQQLPDGAFWTAFWYRFAAGSGRDRPT
jgi:hypothetical protein